ncbi:hypothetical protein SAMN05216302_100415 [Nitrosomonas aestuarii]|uniref:Uncharacterized protein n=1 Tax=Nitrosomonas aestuarii TaxID=52441 RepID=A0A1I3YIU0_9PROT|nr:hypothetical protein SAMN05216302_100415 [Nitrosomonas aestuarii]
MDRYQVYVLNNTLSTKLQSGCRDLCDYHVNLCLEAESEFYTSVERHALTDHVRKQEFN